MRILLASYEFPPLGGGGGHVVAGLMAGLVAEGHEVDLLTMAWSGRDVSAFGAGATLHEVRCVRLRPDRCSALELGLYLLPAWLRMRRLMRDKQYDVCHVHFILPDGLISWFLRKTTAPPLIMTAHGSDVPGYNPDRFRTLHRLLIPLWRRLVTNAAFVICPSPSLAAMVRASAPEAKVRVIPNGFEPASLRDDRARRKRVVVVSRLHRRKGTHRVIEAFGNIDTEFELHIVGDGPELPSLRQQAAPLGERVRFWGWIDNADPQLRDLLETSSVLVLFSEAENFPVSLLEAMAAGLAIVTTAGTGCADVVGDAAVLVAPDDVDGLKRALSDLLGDPARMAELGAAGRARLEQRFTWKRVVRDHVRLYEEAGAIEDQGRCEASRRPDPEGRDLQRVAPGRKQHLPG